jgi:preprotein translocase subunit SecE
MADEQALEKTAGSWIERTKDYIDGLKLEMKRVTWPSWDQVRATTGVVVFAVFAFAAYFAIVDTVINRGIQTLFDKFTK